MLIDFQYEQQKKFDALALDILQRPKHFLNFDCISDFYQAPWLQQFPTGTQWSATGLDDGAEEYCICIEYKAQSMFIDYAAQHLSVTYEWNGLKRSSQHIA